MYRLSETTLAWVERSQLLEGGEGVEALSPAELKRLIALLTVETLPYIHIIYACVPPRDRSIESYLHTYLYIYKPSKDVDLFPFGSFAGWNG